MYASEAVHATPTLQGVDSSATTIRGLDFGVQALNNSRLTDPLLNPEPYRWIPLDVWLEL